MQSIFIYQMHHLLQSQSQDHIPACTTGCCSCPPFFQANLSQLCQAAWRWAANSRFLSCASHCLSDPGLGFDQTNSVVLWSMSGGKIFFSEAKVLLQMETNRPLGYPCIYCIQLSSTCTSLPGPAAKNHPHSIMLRPPCFTVGMVCLWLCAVVGVRQS